MDPQTHPHFARGSGVFVGRNRTLYRNDGGHRYGHNKLDTLPLTAQLRASTHIDKLLKIHGLKAHSSKDATNSRDDQIQKKQKFL
jgi:hypothetical protein